MSGPSETGEWTPERHIRMVRAADAAEIAAIYRPSVIDAATSFEIDAPDGDEMARRIEAVLVVAPWPPLSLRQARALDAWPVRLRD